MKPGTYYDMPAAEYHASEGVSVSGLKYFMRSPAHYHEYLKGRRDTDAMRIGRAFHLAVLEPDKIGAEIAVAPKCDRSKKDGKVVYAEFAESSTGKTIVSADEWDGIKGMAASVAAHPAASKLLTGRWLREASLFATHAATGLTLRARCDLLPALHDAPIVDLKSCSDARPGAFAKDIESYGYHVQAAFYLDQSARLCTEHDGFTFIAVEKEPPYAVAVYELDPLDIQEGREKYEAALRLFAQCKLLDSWPAYPSTVQQISRPKWARQPSAQL